MASGLPQERLRILVVDDDRFMLDMLPMWLARAFTQPGLEIHTARSPTEALAFLDEGCVEVVLSDYDLRDSVNGVKLLEQASARCPEAVRVLFSGHAREEIGRELESPGLHGFIEKPMRIQEMMEPLRGIIARHQAKAS